MVYTMMVCIHPEPQFYLHLTSFKLQESQSQIDNATLAAMQQQMAQQAAFAQIPDVVKRV